MSLNPFPKVGSSKMTPRRSKALAANNQMAKYAQIQKNQSQSGQTMQSVLASFGGNPPPGSKISASGGVDIPLNRELSAEELSSITAERVFKPTAEDIQQMTRDGVFDAKMTKGIPLVQNLERTYRQYVAGQANAVFTSLDPNLQAVQGKINSIRRYVFGEGGKQLTPYEANIVNALIKPTGKSDNQYVNDLDEALKLIVEKANLSKGGANAPPLKFANPIPGAPGSFGLERKQALEAIQIEPQRRKQIEDMFYSKTRQHLNG